MDFPKSVPGVGLVNGQFVDEDPLAATPGSLIPSAWGNSITAEVLNVIEAAGLSPDENDLTQLLAAIEQRVAAGAVPFATQSEAESGESPSKAMSPLRVFQAIAKVVTQATETAFGWLKIGTQTQVNTGASDSVGVTPKKLSAALQAQAHTAFPTDGVAGALTLTPVPAISAYLPYQRFTVKFKFDSTGADTMNWSGKGDKNLKQYDATGNKIAAVFAVDQVGDVLYDGADIVLLDQLPGVPPVTQSGVVGSVRNLRMSLTAANASGTVTADELIVEAGAYGSSQYRIAGFNKVVNLGSVGAGGMDVGVAPVNGYVALYAIYKPGAPLSATNPAILAQNATAGVVGNLYGGANMPAGYIASALISVWPTDAAGLLKAGFQMDREIYIPATNALSSGTATAYSPVSISGVVPPNAKTCSGHLAPRGTSGSTAWLAGSASGIGEKSAGGNTAVARPPVSAYSGLPLITAQTVFYYQLASTGVSVVISGYTF